MKRSPPWKQDVPRIVAVYVVFGMLWIVGSDTLLLLGERAIDTRQALASVAKGMLFLAVTATALGIVLRRSLHRELDRRERLALVLDHTTEGVWLLDHADLTLWVNPALARMLGHDAAELEGCPALDFVPPAALPIWRAQLDCRDEGAPAFESQLRANDGRVLTVRAMRVPSLDAGGNYRGACLFVTDISESSLLREAYSVRQQGIEQLPFGFTLSDARDPSLPLIYVNPSFCAMTGFSAQEVIGRNCRFLQAQDRDQPDLMVLRQALRAGQTCVVTLRNYRADGSLFYNELTMIPIRDQRDVVTHFAGIQHDVTARLSLQRRTEQLAYEDPLTGLLSRYAFVRYLDSRRGRLQGWAVLVVDLLRLRDINETRGHVAGDQLLCALAERLQQQLRPDEVGARSGSDEFIVLLRGDGNLEVLRARANTLLLALAAPCVITGSEIIVQLSAGLAVLEADSEGEAMIDHADAAAHIASDSGGGGIVVYDEAMRAAQASRIRTTQELGRALEAGEFELYYEPKIGLKDGAIVGAEALLRWHHPQRGLLTAGHFIQLAEHSGLIVPIGAWVIDSACAQLRRWLDTGADTFRLSINVSRVQFDRSDLQTAVAAAIARHRIPPGQLCLELTESLLMDESGLLRQRLDALRALGVELSIDDFGTGYSSLSYLQSFSVDEMKIDRRFIGGLPGDAYACAIVPMMIGLGHALGLRVTAEGVETAAQRDWLETRGCDYAQGYLYARPMPAQDFERVLLAAGRDSDRVAPGAGP